MGGLSGYYIENPTLKPEDDNLQFSWFVGDEAVMTIMRDFTKGALHDFDAAVVRKDLELQFVAFCVN